LAYPFILRVLLCAVAGVVLLAVTGFRRPAAASDRAEDVRTVVSAAKSALGTRYRLGGASRRGFDCSGLTMWAWEHADVSLPHSARLQHRATDHVRRRRLERGDLLFFYRPISHVAIYLGHGRMIHANHIGGSVRRSDVLWGHFTDGGRP
jgi:cell wall-associated NlpC family hydrolase